MKSTKVMKYNIVRVRMLTPLLLLLSAALFSACSSDDDYINEPRQEDANISYATMSIDDFRGDDNAAIKLRTNINADGKFLWARGDQVGVWPTLEEGEEPTASQVLFTIQDGAGTNSATFTGSGWGLLHNRTYYAYYPYNTEAMSNRVECTYQTGLNQMFNNMTLHLGANDFMYASAVTPAEGNSADFQFHHLGSIMRIVVSLPAAASSTVFKTAALTAAGGKSVFPSVMSYNPTEVEPQPEIVSATTSQRLILGISGNGFKPTANTITLWFLIGATDLTGQAINVSLSSATTTYSGTFVGSTQQAGHARSYSVSVTEGTIDEDFVDMGTGVMWATSNLGAASEENFGDYFAWGETSPHYSSITVTEATSSPQMSAVTWKSGYTAGYAWSNYFDTSDGGKTFKTYNKSNMKLSLADDAAHVILGDKWRMPTTEEVVALYDCCTYAAATVKGVRGVRFTSKKTGNSIFLPGNGYINGTSYTCSNNGFRLWTSSNKSTTLAFGWHCTYSSPTDEFKQYDRDRLRGYGIRPVYDPNM